MDDAEYLFHQDCKEKKNIGRGYFAKNRTGKGRVKFPSDYLTKKEKNKMNGEVVSWDLNKIYSWEEFKALPNDLKLPYLQKLVDTYSVTLRDISKYQFRISRNTITMHFRSIGLSTKSLHLYGSGYIKSLDGNRVRYQQATDEALGVLEEEPKEKSAKRSAKTKEVKKEEPVNKVDETPEKPQEPEKGSSPTLNRISFEMDGWNYLLLDMISKSFGNKNVRVSITVEEV